MPALQESGDEGSSCAIAYGFKGKLHRPGLLKFDKKDEHEIKVVARGLLVDSTPVTVGPSTCIVKRCCCIKSGRSASKQDTGMIQVCTVFWWVHLCATPNG